MIFRIHAQIRAHVGRHLPARGDGGGRLARADDEQQAQQQHQQDQPAFAAFALGEGIVAVFGGECRQAAQARERQAARGIGDPAMEIALPCLADPPALDDHPS
jgi:hypothetical protein